MCIKEIITNNLAILLLHFAIVKKPCFLAKCNIDMVLKVRVGIRRILFGSDIQALEFSEQGAGIYSQLFGGGCPITFVTTKCSFYHECFHLP
jgi:hypothetical protein